MLAFSSDNRVQNMRCCWVSVPHSVTVRAAQLGFFLIRRQCCLGTVRAGFQTHRLFPVFINPVCLCCLLYVVYRYMIEIKGE